MENFDSKEKPAAPALPPEVEEYQQLVADIKKNESGMFSDHSGRMELSGKLEEAAKKLAEHDTAFKEVLVETFRKYVEQGLSSHSGERWMDKVFIEAFSKYQGIHH